MYGCAAWTLTKSMEDHLRVERRRMLRMMFGAKRRVLSAGASESEDESEGEDEEVLLEPWSEFISRVTHHIDDKMHAYKMEDWVARHRRHKWRFAGHTAQCSDGRWSKKLLSWRPLIAGGHRVGRPNTRWADCIVAVAGEDWAHHALDKILWSLSPRRRM